MQVFQKLLDKALVFAGKCDFQKSSEKLKAASQIQDYFATFYDITLDLGCTP